MANVYKAQNDDGVNKQNNDPIRNWNNEMEEKKYNLDNSASKLNLNFVHKNTDNESKNS